MCMYIGTLVTYADIVAFNLTWPASLSLSWPTNDIILTTMLAHNNVQGPQRRL